MSGAPPFFSIVVPTRNRPDSLKRALGSIAEQSFRDYEVLVVDDGSDPEPAQQVAETLEGLGGRFRLVRRSAEAPRHGPNVARNDGLRRATGRYVGFLDDDDYWCAPDHLEVAAGCLDGRDVDVFVADQIAVRDGETIVSPWLPHLEDLARRGTPIEGTDAVPFRRTDLLRPGGIGFFHVNTILARREVVAATGGFWDPAPYEGDLDFFFRLVDRADTFVYRPSTVSVNTVRPPAAETGVSSLDGAAKLLFRIAACQHAEMLCTKPETRRYARLLHGGALKTMSKQAYDSGDVRLASEFARRAVAVDPSLRWRLISLGLRARAIVTG